MRGRTSWPLRNRSVYAGKKCLVATAAAAAAAARAAQIFIKSSLTPSLARPLRFTNLFWWAGRGRPTDGPRPTSDGAEEERRRREQ